MLFVLAFITSFAWATSSNNHSGLTVNEINELTRYNSRLKGELPLEQLENELTDVEHSIVAARKITNWTSLGHQWALGVDENGKPVVLKDLAMVFPGSLSFFKSMNLGIIGAQEASFKKYMQHVWTGIRDVRLTYVTRKAIGILNKSALSNTSATSILIQKYGPNWNKQLKWKKHKNHSSTHEIKVADLDLMAMININDLPKVEKIIKKLNQFAVTDSELISGENLLNGISFNLLPSGAVEAYYQQQFENFRNSIPTIVNFDDPLSGMKKAIKMRVIKEALKQLIDLIQVPILREILKIAVSNWFDYYNQMLDAHLLAFIEILDQSTLDSDHEFNQFSEQEKVTIFKAIYMSKISFSRIWKRIRYTPSKIWQKQLISTAKTVIINNKKLSKLKLNYHDFGPWIKQGRDQEGPVALYALGQPVKYSFFNSSLPIAVDYRSPYVEIVRRRLVALIEDSLEFITPPFPFADKIMDYLYDKFVNGPIKEGVKWEARVSSSLKYRAQSLGENWDYEIGLLNIRRLNPFELNLRNERALIQKRKDSLGI